jgi:hypothetical protein
MCLARDAGESRLASDARRRASGLISSLAEDVGHSAVLDEAAIAGAITCDRLEPSDHVSRNIDNRHRQRREATLGGDRQRGLDQPICVGQPEPRKTRWI